MGPWHDRTLSVLALLLYATAGFWLSLMAIMPLSVHLGWLPTGEGESIGAGYLGWTQVFDLARRGCCPGQAGFRDVIVSTAALFCTLPGTTHRQ